MPNPETTEAPVAVVGTNSAHSRMHRIFTECGITRDMIQARAMAHHQGGRFPDVTLYAWSYSPGIVAAMLQLVVEAMTHPDEKLLPYHERDTGAQP